MPAIPVSRRLVGAGLLAAALASGCATTTAPLVPDAIEGVSSAPEPEAPEFIPVVRYGRYTLVELAPTAAQRDLLLQTIDVSMPEDPGGRSNSSGYGHFKFPHLTTVG
ncbi:hypothetical protein BLA13014_06935 [Burkholderia aenigmatica]|uniref:Uncharacterized protein n=1 Tax=Burkholderia aenigmatica TaxID=2015348 RepID=A0A6P2RWP2_9BURK|nr:hypothetical protein BLA13014_06935 [Burkholderia aenigmatica]